MTQQTAMQKLIERLHKTEKQLDKENNLIISSALFAAKSMALESLELEKEQIQKAFSDGQEIPIKHPTIPHYSREEYYNDNYNQNK